MKETRGPGRVRAGPRELRVYGPHELRLPNGDAGDHGSIWLAFRAFPLRRVSSLKDAAGWPIILASSGQKPLTAALGRLTVAVSIPAPYQKRRGAFT